LSNPLAQMVGIVFIGDSITWGRVLVNGAIFEPRDGTLSDPRNNFISESYVNEFKRYIGEVYANNSIPVHSNWLASPSGESTTEYKVNYVIFPSGGDFTNLKVGSSVSVAKTQSVASKTGWVLTFSDGNVAGTSYQGISFNFTGESFDLVLATIKSEATYYDIYIDGTKHGTYSTHVGVDGFVEGSNNKRTHKFNYVRNKIVEIRTNRNGENTGNRRLRIEAIEINKSIVITNQGINGATCPSYTMYNLQNNTYGDGEAVGVKDDFVFVQLGTNDRIIKANVPRGYNTFKDNLKLLIDKILPLSNVILMCANPVEESASYSFTQNQARDVIYRVGKENNIDFIDNNTIFAGMNLDLFTTDNVHPNMLGHRIIKNNITNA
ncbi:MAG: SGNH/GDSL hydrolase family protein, partial [Clostridium sp.]